MRAPEFWRAQAKGLDVLWPALLTPVSLAWRLAAWRRRRSPRARRVPIPVICVGNLVVGGAGKTPTVLALAERLRTKDIRVHIVSRGYGGRLAGPLLVDPQRHDAREVGDEPLLLARAAPTWIARRRAAAAAAALEAGAELLLLDDGFQDPSLHHDLALVVVDAAYGLGNGRVMPAGPLREPAHLGLARASALVLIGAAANAPPPLEKTGLPLLRAQVHAEPPAALNKDRTLVAFAGIGQPEKFFVTLEALGYSLHTRHPFPDHHFYRDDEIARLQKEAEAAGAQLVTTEKDLARLSPAIRPKIAALPISLRFADPEALDRLLAPLCRKAAKHAGR